MTDPVEEQAYRWLRRYLLLLTMIAVAILVAAAFIL
jgi:hypothetical protein